MFFDLWSLLTTKKKHREPTEQLGKNTEFNSGGSHIVYLYSMTDFTSTNYETKRNEDVDEVLCSN